MLYEILKKNIFLLHFRQLLELRDLVSNFELVINAMLLFAYKIFVFIWKYLLKIFLTYRKYAHILCTIYIFKYLLLLLLFLSLASLLFLSLSYLFFFKKSENNE